MACAGQRSDGTLFACGANFMPDFFALARSRDGLSWTKTFRFSELAGPLECPAGTGEHDLCAPMWPTLASQFGAVGVGSAIDAGTVGGKSKDGCGCGVSPALLLVLVQPWRGRRSRRRCA
jgi:hypothetical protein